MNATAGYSATPLVKKLGFRPGWTVLLRAAPAGYAELLAGAEDVTFTDLAKAPDGGAEAAHVFLHGPDDLDTAGDAIPSLAPGGMLWLSWAKKSSPLHAGVTEDDLRAAILPLGWVDVKVCAVDADWSGLKFLKRKG